MSNNNDYDISNSKDCETYINQFIDNAWKPYLQTPPFPEYTSGHSVASSTTAEILTHLFGENFAYEDTVEKEFGLPTRKYQSFKHHPSDRGSHFITGWNIHPST